MERRRRIELAGINLEAKRRTYLVPLLKILHLGSPDVIDGMRLDDFDDCCAFIDDYTKREA